MSQIYKGHIPRCFGLGFAGQNPMTPEELESLQSYLRWGLTDSGLSMRAFAEHAGLGVDVVRDILRGKSKRPRLQTVEAIARYMNTSVDEILGRTGSMTVSRSFEDEEQIENAIRLTNFISTVIQEQLGEEYTDRLLAALYSPTAPESPERAEQDKFWNDVTGDVKALAKRIGKEFSAPTKPFGFSKKPRSSR